MSSIPYDVIGEILICLPVKDLLRFRCVSKFFGSLIDSPDFAKQNLCHSQKTNTNLYGTFETVKFKHIMLFDLSRSVNNVSVETVNRPPSCHQTLLRQVLGSCNGLVALSCNNKGNYFGNSKKNVVIWNPLTAKYKEITSPVPSPNSRTSYGFGYNPRTDDYKLVRIAMCRKYDKNNKPNNQSAFRADIYSLKTNSWKFIMDKRRYLKRWYLNCWEKEVGVLVNNVLHWGILNNYRENKVVAFDLVKGSFHFLQVPTCVNSTRYSIKLSVLNGCLTLSSSIYKSAVYVWILKEYGVEKSWTKLLHFDWSSMIRKMLLHPYIVTPLAYSRDGDKLLFNHCDDVQVCDLHWYDLSSNKDRIKSCLYKRNTTVVKRRGDVRTFVGSLVSPDESKDWVNLKRKQQSIDMKRETKRTRGDLFLRSDRRITEGGNN